ncbi:MAG: agmatinase family protein [Planctomycetota bacterium]
MSTFDPNAAAAPGSGLFGLSCDPATAGIVVVPAPFDATTSYRPGTAAGPAAILAASHQVDLFDVQTGRCYERGIALLEDEAGLRALSRQARAQAEPILQKGGADAGDGAAVAAVDAAGDRLNAAIGERVAAILARGQIPAVVGGDHSVSFGAIASCAERAPGLGILHIDAHADLRPAYEGFRWSHASIMHNVLGLDGVGRIVQVGIRDLCEAEQAAITASAGRVITHFDIAWQRRLAGGEPYRALCDEAIEALPRDVYVSFDIDGLDPSLCPHTGTPVPGGLSFVQACLLLETLQQSGRRIVGFDLVEVAPGPDGDEWDAAVGARLLYKLCGFALLG